MLFGSFVHRVLWPHPQAQYVSGFLMFSYGVFCFHCPLTMPRARMRVEAEETKQEQRQFESPADNEEPSTCAEESEALIPRQGNTNSNNNDVQVQHRAQRKYRYVTAVTLLRQYGLLVFIFL